MWLPDDVTGLDAAETLAATVRTRAGENQLGVDRLLLAVHYADLHPSPAMVPGDQTLPGRERGLICGGPGCPGVAEFAVAEYGAVSGVTAESAAKDIGQALALRHRLPLTWDRVLSGQATAWKARLIATACLGLSLDAAAVVDRRVCGIVDSLSATQVNQIVRAALWDADPAAARAAAEENARQRGVSIGRSDEYGSTKLFVKAATGDVIRFDATIAQIADALAAMGDPDPVDTRRAKAIGILADPALAHELLNVAQYLATHQRPTTNTPTGGDTPACDTPAATTPDTDTPTDRPDPSGPTDHRATTGDAAPTEDHQHTDHPEPTNDIGATRDIGPVEEPAWTGWTGKSPSTADPRQAGEDPGADAPRAAAAQVDEVTRDGQPAGDLFLADEPDHTTDADRDTPHPSHPDHPLDPPPAPPRGTGTSTGTGRAEQLVRGMDAAARQDLAAKLAAIKQAADTNSNGGGSPGRRPGRTKLYVHITDETLLAGGGTARVEAFGPVFAAKLAELLGHGHLTVQPVIDLNQHVSVNAYEIPHRIRERVKLTYPVEQFPYGPGQTTASTDLDHVTPYNPAGPPGQTSTHNLRPLRRLSHRIKTHAGWKVRALDHHALEWTTPHGYKFRVDHTGTHPTDDET